MPGAQVAGHVLGRLLGDAAKGHPGLLGLDDPGRLTIDKQQIVTVAGGQVEFPHRHSHRRLSVEVASVLGHPACISQQLVDLGPGLLFRLLHIVPPSFPGHCVGGPTSALATLSSRLDQLAALLNASRLARN